MKYVSWIILILVVVLIGWGVFFRSPEPVVEGVKESVEEQQKILEVTAVVLQTNFGDIRIALDTEAAPKTVENFVKLVQQGFYDGLTFHRVVPGFVIQGGDPLADGTGGPGYTIPAEINLKHLRGAVAMARRPDPINPERESSGSQFYIALQDLPSLDGQYTVFGRVLEGTDVVDEIAKVGTDASDRPLEEVIINKAVVVEAE